MATVLNKIIDLARLINVKIDLLLAGAQKTHTFFIILGFMVSSALNFVTDVDVLSRIDLVSRLFSGDFSRGVWAILPLAGFLFLRK